MKEKAWETLLAEAIASLKEAHRAMDDIAGWSGSAGNWTLHDELIKVKKALLILTSNEKTQE